MLPRRRPLLLALPALALGATAARGQGSAIPAVASFSILGDMVRHIAGARVALRVIAGPDADAHTFQPRPSDSVALRDAALTVRNGLGFDPWFDRMLRSAAPAGAVRVTATDGIEPITMEGHHHHHHGGGTERRTQHSTAPRRVPDPHAWQDLRHAQTYARNIARGLAAADAAMAERHLAAGEAYAARLADLDRWVRQEIGRVPPERRRVITSHDAFGYFGAAYGVEFLAPQGISTNAEATPQQVASLIRQIRAQNITAVFVEQATNPATLERLAREAGVAIRGRLYADSLSAEGGPAATYEAMVRHNVGLMVPAMLGRAAL
jgi:zinc/manganese transport system substrate-binding protein